MEMGFTRERVAQALREANNDVQMATVILLQDWTWINMRRNAIETSKCEMTFNVQKVLMFNFSDTEWDSNVGGYAPFYSTIVLSKPYVKILIDKEYYVVLAPMWYIHIW